MLRKQATLTCDIINCPHALEIPPEQVDYAREFAKSFGWHSDDNHIDLCPGCRA
jgi:hypothetical protein